MKLMQVLLSPRIGGAETMAESLNTAWGELGVSAVTEYLDCDDTAATSRLTRLTALRRRIRAIQPDAVIAHSALPSIYSRIAARSTVPVVIVLHAATDDYADATLRIAERILRHRTSHVVAVSESQAKRYAARFGSRVPLTVIPNGVSGSLTPRRTYSQSAAHIVTMARVTPQKNPGLWLSVALDAVAEDNRLRFTWYGPIQDDPKIHAIVRQAQGHERIRFAGPVSNAPRMLYDADILFHPSDREAHSLTLLEGAAVGVPIVCAQEVNLAMGGRLAAQVFAAGSPASALAALKKTCSAFDKAAMHARAQASDVGMQSSSLIAAERYVNLISNLRVGSGSNEAF